MLSFLLKPRGWSGAFLLIILISIIVAIDYTGVIDPVLAFLNSDRLSFTFKEVRVSALTIVKSLLYLFGLLFVSGILSSFVEKRIDSLKRLNQNYRTLLIKGFNIALYATVFVVILDSVGIPLAALTVLGGAIGIGVGFGLQKIAANFISGIILLFEKSLEVGDLLELGDGTSGFVRRSNARYTLIESFDGREIMVPNETLISQNVINWTYTHNLGRVDIVVGVAYGSDLEQVRSLLLDAANAHPQCSKNKGASCFLTDFADSSINFLLTFWVDDTAKGRLGPKSDVMLAIWKKFQEKNIEIPFPQRDLHIKGNLATEALPATKKTKAT